LSACPLVDGYKYRIGTFPETPVNMGDINSEYDDYNSTSPELGGTTPLCFSSNRNGNHKDFDIIYKLLDVYMSKSTGILEVEENTKGSLDVFAANASLNDAIRIINTGFDELGPYLIPQGHSYLNQEYIFLYATNESGNFDIKFTQNLTGDSYSSPLNIKFLNSAEDDLYPTLTADSSTIYFCSNRGGNFDIYKADLNKNNNLLSEFSDSIPRIITKDTILSSNFDDKCPFIIGKLMVFASNRSGGYGGFDLYYSVFNNGEWSAPVNFGDKINTQYDEYRPIVKSFAPDFTNDFMIFSTNRPGGKGGFDLYYVGIDRMTK
jgi:Tol biopolymer transport system component